MTCLRFNTQYVLSSRGKVEIMDSNFENVLSRAKKILKADKDLLVAEAIGMTASAFNNRKRSGSVPYAHFIDFAKARNVDLNWLFSGVGPIYKDNKSQGSEDQKANPPVSENKAENVTGRDPSQTQARVKELEAEVGRLEAQLFDAAKVIVVYERGQKMIEAFMHNDGMIDLTVLRPGSSTPPKGSFMPSSHDDEEFDLDSDTDDDTDSSKAAG